MAITRTDFADRTEYVDGGIKYTIFKETPARMVAEFLFSDARINDGYDWSDIKTMLDGLETFK